MPNRTDLQREVIDNSPKKEPDEYCNARTGNPDRPYCRMRAGFKTDHVGNGRCYLHGGRAGRPIINAYYSKELTSTLREEYEKAIEDPNMVDLYAELAVSKVMFGNFLSKIKDDLESGRNIWTDTTAKGTPIVSAEAQVLLKLMDNISRMYQRIVDAEAKSQQNLTLKQIYAIVQQIKYAMGVCGECPVRSIVGNKLAQIRIDKFGEEG